MNERGCAVDAIRPPTSAPSPMPRFITTRCIPNVMWRSPGGVRPTSSVDCAGPEEAVAEARHGGGQERLPRMVHRRVPDEADREQDERGREHAPAAEPVDERAGDRAGDERDGGVRREHEAGDRQRDAAHVVEVDQRERQHDAVAERVAEAAELERSAPGAAGVCRRSGGAPSPTLGGGAGLGQTTGRPRRTRGVRRACLASARRSGTGARSSPVLCVR